MCTLRCNDSFFIFIHHFSKFSFLIIIFTPTLSLLILFKEICVCLEIDGDITALNHYTGLALKETLCLSSPSFEHTSATISAGTAHPVLCTHQLPSVQAQHTQFCARISRHQCRYNTFWRHSHTYVTLTDLISISSVQNFRDVHISIPWLWRTEPSMGTLLGGLEVSCSSLVTICVADCLSSRR